MTSSAGFPKRALRRLLLPLVAIAAARGETVVIRPILTYTVSSLENGAFRSLMPNELYSNGYSPGTYSAKATVARMEFRIPREVLVGLQTMEFKAQQTGVLPGSTGYEYLWFYSGIDSSTTKDLTLKRSGFTARDLTTSGQITRNLLEGFSSASGPRIERGTQIEKLGLAFTTYTAQHNDWIRLVDPQLVITYEPPPPSNGAVVTKLLAEPSAPFEGMTDPAVIGFDADPDQDGIPNFFELWRGTDPGQADQAPLPAFGTTAGDTPGTKLVTVKVEVSSEGDDYLLVGAQASHDLKNWRDVSATRTTLVEGTKRYACFTDTEPLGNQAGCYFRFFSEEEGTNFD